MPQFDFATARRNMVDGQVRTDDVTSPELVAALREIPREIFVPAAKRAVAYASLPIEIGRGRFLADPRAFAKMVQAVEIGPDDVVLDVGCGTGYGSAVLSRLAAAVVALEEDPDLAAEAIRNLRAVGADSAAVVTGPLAGGHAGQGPYDAIVLEGAVEETPQALLDQLKPGGRLVGVVTDKTGSRAHIFTRAGAGWSSRAAFDAALPVLPGFAREPGFTF